MHQDVPIDWLREQIALSQSGDESARTKAWDELAAYLWPRIKHLAIMEVRRSWHIQGSWDVAEDIAVNTFMVAFTKIGLLREPAGIIGWLRVILQRQLLQRYRKLKREHLTDVLPDGAHFSPNSGTSIVAQLRFEIARLPLAQRRVLHVRYWEDLEATECAEILGVSLGTVWVHLRKAHNNLRQALLDAGFTGTEEAGTT